MTHRPSLYAPVKPGDPVAAIETPALVIDLDAMARNLAAVAAFANERGLRLRPHDVLTLFNGLGGEWRLARDANLLSPDAPGLESAP